MTAREDSQERINFSLNKIDSFESHVAELADAPTEPKSPFVPVGVADMQYKGAARARILPPDMLSEIIEEHAKSVASQAAPEPAPVAEIPAPPVAAEPAPEPEPEISQLDKVTQMADEVLPPSGTTTTKNPDGPVLSPDEVKKLLNEA